jgi:hypothetical protein
MGEGGSDSKTRSKNSILLQFVPPAQVSAGQDPSAAGGRGGGVAVAEHPIVASCVQAGALPLHIEGVQDLEGLGAEVNHEKQKKATNVLPRDSKIQTCTKNLGRKPTISTQKSHSLRILQD